MLNLHAIVAAIRSGQWITRDRIRVYPMIFLAIFLAGLTWLIVNPRESRWNGSDFAGFWVPAHLAVMGRAKAIYDQQLFATLQQAISGSRTMYLPWVYPPTFLLLIMPLGMLSYLTAFAVWISAGLAIYCLALRKLTVREGWVAALAFPGVMTCIGNGHAEILLAGLFGGAIILLDRRPWIAGLLIGLCAVKPHLFLLVPVALLAARCWRPIVGAAVMVVLGAAMSVAVFGTGLWHEFFLSVSGVGGTALRNGVSYATMLAKQQSVFAFGLRFGDPILAAILQAAAIALAGWTVAVTWSSNRSLGERSIVLCCGTLLASPYLFDYDLVLLAVPIAILVHEGLAKGFPPWQKSLLSALWLAPALVRIFSYYGDLPATLILLGLSIANVVAAPRRTEGRFPAARPAASQESPAAVTA